MVNGRNKATYKNLNNMGRSTGQTIPVKLPFKYIMIELNWHDGIGKGGKGFATVQEFAEFLKANTELAQAVGYVPKK